MGLDDGVFGTVRSNIILQIIPIPIAKAAYGMIIKEENHRNMTHSNGRGAEQHHI